MTLHMYDLCGPIAENKDIARDIRKKQLIPTYKKNKETIVLDFTHVESTSQSFIHALISEIFEKSGEAALQRFEFLNCNETLSTIISTVINYSLE